MLNDSERLTFVASRACLTPLTTHPLHRSIYLLPTPTYQHAPHPPHAVLSHHVLPHPVLPHLVLPHLVLPCPAP
jgi:hypothetical protein